MYSIASIFSINFNSETASVCTSIQYVGGRLGIYCRSRRSTLFFGGLALYSYGLKPWRICGKVILIIFFCKQSCLFLITSYAQNIDIDVGLWLSKHKRITTVIIQECNITEAELLTNNGRQIKTYILVWCGTRGTGCITEHSIMETTAIANQWPLFIP